MFVRGVLQYFKLMQSSVELDYSNVEMFESSFNLLKVVLKLCKIFLNWFRLT